MSRDQSNEDEEGFGLDAVAMVEHVQSHRVPLSSGCGAGVTGTAADCVAAERGKRGVELARRLTERRTHSQLEISSSDTPAAFVAATS